MADEEIILVDAAVEVDDEAVTIEGNTLSFTEGTGENSVKAASKGGKVVVVVSQDVTTKISSIKFDMPASVANMNKSRDWGVAGSGRVVRISGTDAAGNRLGRTMTQGVNTNDPEKNVQNEGKISVEFMGAPLTVS